MRDAGHGVQAAAVYKIWYNKCALDRKVCGVPACTQLLLLQHGRPLHGLGAMRCGAGVETESQPRLKAAPGHPCLRPAGPAWCPSGPGWAGAQAPAPRARAYQSHATGSAGPAGRSASRLQKPAGSPRSRLGSDVASVPLVSHIVRRRLHRRPAASKMPVTYSLYITQCRGPPHHRQAITGNPARLRLSFSAALPAPAAAMQRGMSFIVVILALLAGECGAAHAAAAAGRG